MLYVDGEYGPKSRQKIRGHRNTYLGFSKPRSLRNFICNEVVVATVLVGATTTKADVYDKAQKKRVKSCVIAVIVREK